MVEVEAITEPGNPHDHTAIALDLNGTRIGYLPRGISGKLFLSIKQLNTAGFRVLLVGRIEPNSTAPKLEVRGSWPNEIHTWLSLPRGVRPTEYFELDWVKTDYQRFHQAVRHSLLGGSVYQVLTCEFHTEARRINPYRGADVGPAGEPAVPRVGTYVDIFASDRQIGEIRGVNPLDESPAGRRIRDGQMTGLARLAQREDYIDLQVCVPCQDGTHPRTAKTFMWFDEIQALENLESVRHARAWAAENVDGKPYYQHRGEVDALKRAGDLEAAATLGTKLIDAVLAAAEIRHQTPGPTLMFLEVAIILRKLGRIQDEVAMLEKYISHCPEGTTPDRRIVDRADKAKRILQRRG
ncbi:hypothetical protein [Nocardia sp. NPDC051981]|uniref:hypothetical protein n=1 Tax=Nocardia sp. NPDC051981 TaxID=3155417 RepID=UPI003417861E